MYKVKGWATPSFEMTDLIGKVMKSAESDEYQLELTAENGDKYIFHHFQDCCETVHITDLVGDLQDLVGSPIIEAEEAGNSEWKDNESYTWTFYKLGTQKGHVNVRWEGCSNGYYSEAVDLSLVKAGEQL